MLEGIVFDSRHTRGDIDSCEASALGESIASKVRHTRGDGDGGEAIAILKSTFFDARHAHCHSRHAEHRELRGMTIAP